MDSTSNFYRRALSFKLLIILLCLGTSSCAWVKNIGKSGMDQVANTTREELDKIRAEVFPLDSAGKHLVMGILEGVSTPASQHHIDTLSKNLTASLSHYLNEKLQSLDTRSVGSNLVNGMIDTLTSQKTQQELESLIKGVLLSLDSSLESTIASLVDTLTSPATLYKLSLIGASIFSDENAKSLNAFLQKGLNGSIRFDSISEALRRDLLNEKTQAALAKVIPPQIDSILVQTQRILASIEKETESFWSKDIWTLVLAIASLMFLGALLYVWRNGKTHAKLNDLVMSEINRIADQESYDELTGRIWQNAIQHGVQGDLNKRLKHLGLLQNDSWQKSK